MRRVAGPAAVASVLLAAVAAITLMPEPGFTPALGYAGWPRLIVFALAGVLLGLTAADPCIASRIRPARRTTWRAYLLIVLGVAASLIVALVNAQRLRANIADPVGPTLWLVSMALLLVYVLFPQVRRIRWVALWPAGDKVMRWRWVVLAAILLIAAAIRLPDLADIPQGINPDEGDRASTAMDVLDGVAPASWFDSGWFFINMFYFRVLAVSLAVFGTDVQGGRMLSALCGIAFVGVIAWVGCRNFGWRIGLVATAFAAGMQVSIQHSRLITEAGPTAVLWAISIGGFLEGARSGRLWAWTLAGLCGGLGLYFYPSARLWAVGAALTVLVTLAFLRNRRAFLGVALATVASIVAALPFLIHLSTHPAEVSGRYLQTAVLDPRNQERLAYLSPPEALPNLFLLQFERTVGMFDRYPDGGGFLPTGHPLFGPPLAQLALVGSIYLLVLSLRDLRAAVLSIWFWVGLSGVALTVETPDYLRSVGMLPSLCFVLAIPLLDLIDRALPVLGAARRPSLSYAAPGLVAVVLLTPEVIGYFVTFTRLPAGWGPETREGTVIAALGHNGPVYSLEMNEHMVSSGWVRLLAQTTQRGRMPNPGRELPVLAPVGNLGGLRPDFFPTAGQGFSVLMSPDPNQRPYVPLLQDLYPQAQSADAGDQRTEVLVSPVALADTSGVNVSDANGSTWTVDHFGDIPPGHAFPADLTWFTGVRIPTTGAYQLSVTAPSAAQLMVDGVPLGSNSVNMIAASGVHFVELETRVSSANDHVQLAIAGNELTPQQTYRLMDAPWGLTARVARSTGDAASVQLDATVAMAFFDPELGFVIAPNSIVWSGSLIAPRDGTYRMAFASEDTMHLQVDNQPVDVVTVKPEGWATVGVGSQVQLTSGPHRVQVTLDVSHGGRDLARWNWIPPMPSGGMDPSSSWSVVPPRNLRPDASVSVAR